MAHRVRAFAKQHALPIPDLSGRAVDHIAAIAEVAIHCIESGDRPAELATAADDEVMTHRETTTVT